MIEEAAKIKRSEVIDAKKQRSGGFHRFGEGSDGIHTVDPMIPQKRKWDFDVSSTLQKADEIVERLSEQTSDETQNISGDISQRSNTVRRS